MKRTSIIVLALSAFCTAACSSGKTSTAKAGPAAADLKVVSTVLMEGRHIRVSPDSMKVALLKSGQLCVGLVSQVDALRCADALVEPSSMVWSPNSDQVAYTEDFFVQFRDADLHVVDSETREQRNLTDDKVEDVELDASPSVDVNPVWSTDGNSLSFWRLNLSSKKATLHTIDAAGGTPKPTMVELELGMTFNHLERYRDGYVYGTYGRDGESDRGVVLHEQASSSASRLVMKDDPDLGPTRPVDVSESLGEAIVIYPNAMSRFASGPNTIPIPLLNLETGKSVPLSITGRKIVNARFSPDGKQLAIVSRPADGPGPDQLHVRDGVDGTDALLWTAGEAAGPAGLIDGQGGGLQWVEGAIVVSEIQRTSILRLGTS